MKRAIYLAAAAACILGFAGTLYLIFYVAPVDRLLLFNHKIFYYHLGNAWMLFAAVFTCGSPVRSGARRRGTCGGTGRRG
jgi:hypothetical protein